MAGAWPTQARRKASTRALSRTARPYWRYMSGGPDTAIASASSSVMVIMQRHSCACCSHYL